MPGLTRALDLSQAERAKIEQTRTELGNRFCRRCEYCQPCPQDVPVPMLMTAASALKRMPMPRFLNFMGAAVQKAAEKCEKCGECMERCPYGLPILEMMDESISLYRHAEAQYQTASSD